MAPNSKTTKNKQSNKQQTVTTKKNVQDKTTSQSRKKQNNANGRNSRSKQSSSRCLQSIMISILLVGLVSGVLFYDTEVNGKGVFAKSLTGQMLQRVGILPHVERTWYVSMGLAARGYKWSEQNVLPQMKKWGQLICDLTKMGRVGASNIYAALKNYVNANIPVAVDFLEKYFPGLPLQIEKSSEWVKGVTLTMSDKVATFFSTQILVGRFSPDNLSKALNEAQSKAIHYYQEFQKKVDAYAKLK